MHKRLHLREQDYWLYPIIFLSIVAAAAAVYASVIVYRAPVLILAIAGMWFSFNKIKRDYSLNHARMALTAWLITAGILAWAAYVLTN